MLEKSPTRAEELLKYLRDIGIAATRSNNWSKYDEQFRLRMSNQPQASWGHINQEVWLLYISNKQDTSTIYDSNLQFCSQQPRQPYFCLLLPSIQKGNKLPFFPLVEGTDVRAVNAETISKVPDVQITEFVESYNGVSVISFQP